MNIRLGVAIIGVEQTSHDEFVWLQIETMGGARFKLPVSLGEAKDFFKENPNASDKILHLSLGVA